MRPVGAFASVAAMRFGVASVSQAACGTGPESVDNIKALLFLNNLLKSIIDKNVLIVDC